ncbi:hypothetical protein K4A83_20845 [Spirulina subsalsa FACHB-351]|uniref:VWA domain-containing protein n=1 Tax=Spirulina subsalsa FACHB-351 TaxID=234711 RepID=A0ABT3LB37_9CYAN|nr:hypothetical protein [Spirulina subsalsa]MCW6038700.1 hypothetical protein [Spirulina subsalsa FACHB-351]
MPETYTHISIILDRTGSMDTIQDDVIGGFNQFLASQQEETGRATLTLVQFDSQDPYEVIHQFAPLEQVAPLSRETYVPRASTPLLDAIGRGIIDLAHRLATMPAGEKPDQVVFVIITDGQENSSREFTKAQVMKLLAEKQEKDKWQFVFLSADLTALDDAIDYGFHAPATISFDKDSQGTAAVFSSLAKNVKRYRSQEAESLVFDEEDRAQQQSEQSRDNRP